MKAFALALLSPIATAAAAALHGPAYPTYATEGAALRTRLFNHSPRRARSTSMAAFPNPAALGVEGQRCLIIFYAYDGIPKAETLLEAFEDEAKEFNACGCALVAMRRGEMDEGDARKAREYQERFPSINLVGGLERDEFAETRRAVGVGANWFLESFRTLYNDPVATLLDPDGNMRAVLSHKGLSAANVLGNVMRELHVAVPPAAGTKISAAEREATRQSLYNENAQWADVLKEDETLRQPTRFWFDMTPREEERPLLAGVKVGALPAAIDAFLADGSEADAEEDEALISKDGVRAPAWYAKAKRSAESRQEAERLLWNGTAPSASAGPLPLGPAGRRLEPLQGAARKALKEVREDEKVRAFLVQFGIEEWRAIGAGDGAGRAAAGGLPTSGGVLASAEMSVETSEATRSALLRAQMLALGLQRSSTSTLSTRRLRLLREFEASVKELQAEGFNNRAALDAFKEQLRSSYASAPPEFLEGVRRADPFNTALPRLTPEEIVAEFGKLAEIGAEKLRTALEKGVAAPDFDSLRPDRKRGPRELGNKIAIGRAAGTGDETMDRTAQAQRDMELSELKAALAASKEASERALAAAAAEAARVVDLEARLAMMASRSSAPQAEQPQDGAP